MSGYGWFVSPQLGGGARLGTAPFEPGRELVKCSNPRSVSRYS